MGYLIDTNILSELQKGNRCHAGVQRWYAATDSIDARVDKTTFELPSP